MSARLSARPLVTRRRIVATGVGVAFVTGVCAALPFAAALAPAPVEVLPLVIAACLGCPMLAMFELSASIADLRGRRFELAKRRAVEELRRQLRRLPETKHPLGF